MHLCMYMYMVMFLSGLCCTQRDMYNVCFNERSIRKEESEKEASKVKQTTRQSNTAHPRQSFFQRKMS